ncbi:MAG TPA: hypothetical protein VHG09_06990, partial [Longimicrobiales bacterium]|nr:hypothetical protein [Longimicrobiales bacterium]
MNDGIDPSHIRTVPLSLRPNKVSATDFAQPPGERTDFATFLESLPHILEARSFLAVVDALVASAREER